MAATTAKRADQIVPANANEKTVLSFHTSLMKHDLDAFAAIWTEGAIHEHPWRTETMPPAIVGRKQITDSYRNMFANRKDMVFTINGLHQTANPDCIVVEFNGRSLVGETGNIYEQNYVGFFHLRDGKIDHLRLYFDPSISQRALAKIMPKADG